MQTFLPYEDFEKSAAVLDMMRLGKQRVETFQILQKLVGERLITGEKVETGKVRKVSLSEPGTPEDEIEWREEAVSKKVYWPREKWRREPILSKGWGRHPAKVMWEGHELSLLAYQDAVCREWTSRGYADTTWEKSLFLMEPHRDELLQAGADSPPAWLGSEDFHLSHRSNLLRKAPDLYGDVFGAVPDDLPYVWPSHDEE